MSVRAPVDPRKLLTWLGPRNAAYMAKVLDALCALVIAPDWALGRSRVAIDA